MSDELQSESIIDLRRPLEAAGKKVEQLFLRAPRVGERRKAEAHYSRGITPETATRYSVSLIASVAGVSEAIIEQMDVDQMEEAAEYLQGFSERGRKTGGQ